MRLKLTNIRILFITLLLTLIAATGISQQVEFKAIAPEEVSVGEQFRLVFSVNAQANGFKAPPIREFSTLSGPMQGSSSSMQIINNQVSRSVEYSYTYILQASKEGTFTIAPASVVVDGKTYQSSPIKIRVVKGSTQQRNEDQGVQPSADISSKNLFVRASVSKNNPYQGEQVIVTYKIYTRVPLAQYSVTKAPSITGFWAEDLLKNSTQLNQYRETVNGLEYVVAEIKKDALFAQKSGKLVIQPLELDVVAQVEVKNKPKTNDPFFDNFFNDSFFGNSVQNVRKLIYSNPVTINVRPLPTGGKSADFNGAVGNFTINSSIDRDRVPANDALTLKFSVSGKGNLKLIDKPNFIFPSDFEVYDPRVVDDIRTTSAGMSGTRTFEFLMVPRNPGNYTIKPASFVYFDPASGAYKTLQTREFKVTVERGAANSNIARNGSNREDFQVIGTDIRYINTSPLKLKPLNFFLFNSALFWILLLLPVALFILFIIIWQKELKKRSDVALLRNKKATRVAKKRLKVAEHHLKQGNQQAFCSEISNALWGYISDKFNIQRSALSIDSVSDALKNKNVKEEITSKFVNTLNNCEFARFAPGDKSQIMGNLYSEALEVITQTEQELK